MARAKILNMSLNSKSMDRVIQQLTDYSNSLEYKCEQFVERLADIGINVAMMTLAADGQGDSPRGADFKFTSTKHGFGTGNEIVGKITATGDGLIFWEFGAGNVFNTNNEHPKASQFGFGVGTYPGQTHVPDPGYWYYRDENGDAVRSYGTQATMPMYKASIEMITKIRDVAKEVFG